MVRGDAACALAMYPHPAQADEEERETLLRLLAQLVQSDDDAGVKEAIYTALLDTLRRPASEYFHEVRDFDPQRDVNLSLLAPYPGEADSKKTETCANVDVFQIVMADLSLPLSVQRCTCVEG